MRKIVLVPFASAKALSALLLLLASFASTTPVSAQTGPALPSGFHAAVYASGLSMPTAIAIGPDKQLYVAQQTGEILRVTKAGASTIASAFATPLGLAWNRGVLYVSSAGQVSTLTPGKRYLTFRRRVIVSGLPTGKHQNDGMAFRNGWMYLGVGSTCNACAESDARSATIMRFHYDGSHAQIYARGLRNPYGLAFKPGTSRLYATDNGRDDFGDSVPDELNRILQGGRYGWPDCWGKGQGSNCSGTIPAVALFEPHSSADGISFYSGRTFPKSYRGDAFVAEWGDSVNGLGTGHKVKRVHFQGNRVTVSTFAMGLDHPLSVAVAPNGSLLVADYGTGIIWSIQANGH